MFKCLHPFVQSSSDSRSQCTLLSEDRRALKPIEVQQRVWPAGDHPRTAADHPSLYPKSGLKHKHISYRETGGGVCLADSPSVVNAVTHQRFALVGFSLNASLEPKLKKGLKRGPALRKTLLPTNAFWTGRNIPRIPVSVLRHSFLTCSGPITMRNANYLSCRTRWARVASAISVNTWLNR